MKKRTKTIIATLITLVLIPTVAFGAMKWRGAQNVTNIKTNLTLIQEKINTLKTGNEGKDKTIREIEILLEQEKGLREQRDRELEYKKTEVENKIAEIQGKIVEINTLKEQLQAAQQEAQQAGQQAGQQAEQLSAEVERLNTENAQKQTDINALEGELEQALRDVKEIERITEEMAR